MPYTSVLFLLGCYTELTVGSDTGLVGLIDGPAADTDTDTDTVTDTVTDTDTDTTGSPLDGLTDADWAPTAASDGLPGPVEGVYTDLGVADEGDGFRALIGLPIRDEGALAAEIRDLYDPADRDFRAYLTADEWVAAYAPTTEDLELIQAYLEHEGFAVNYVASNRLLIQFSGTVAQFNAAFQADLHVCDRENPQVGEPSFEVYCTLESFTLPAFVTDRTNGIITADLPVDPGPLPGEAGDVVNDAPGNAALLPQDLANAYGASTLYDEGYDGEGVRLGLIIGGMFKFNDVGTFWRSSGIYRSVPEVVYTAEDAPSRCTESTLDVAWAGGIAPGADLIAYVGPDSRNTSMVFNFNEAIGRGEVDILSDSFAHRQDSEPWRVEEAYHQAAEMAAALGITVTAASGDSAKPDTPCVSPYVTCVGGTTMAMSGDSIAYEYAWEYAGSGEADNFDAPYWQWDVLPTATRRGVNDVSAAAGSAFWVYYLGTWQIYAGTSFASPIYAGLMAVVDSKRLDEGKPHMGYLNPVLYSDAAVQGTFNDITYGGTAYYSAGAGWDYPTGWGSPNAAALADALP